MAVNKKLNWLTQSTVQEENSFSPYKNHLYIDLSLDLKQDVKLTPDRNSILGSITNKQKDLMVIYDTDCILHSLYEIFKTPKGARVLVPEFGTDLYKYIGTAITEVACISIKTSLEYDIKRWEPRVRVLGIQVTPEYDNSVIDIDIYIEIPEISTKALAKYRFDSKNGNIEQVMND